jgi:hypothetical protein
MFWIHKILLNDVTQFSWLVKIGKAAVTQRQSCGYICHIWQMVESLVQESILVKNNYCLIILYVWIGPYKKKSKNILERFRKYLRNFVIALRNSLGNLIRSQDNVKMVKNRSLNSPTILYVYIKSRFKSQCHEIFDSRFFPSNNTPWAFDSRGKAFLNSASNSPRYDRFRTQKSCMRCQWHRVHEIFLLGSPFKFIFFLMVW